MPLNFDASARTIEHEHYSALLSELSFEQGLTNKQRAKRLEELYKSKSPDSLAERFFNRFFNLLTGTKREPGESNFTTNLANLEGAEPGRPLSLNDLIFLSQVYDVSPLTFWPLTSKLDDPIVYPRLADDYYATSGPGKTLYRFPSLRLKECDSMVVVVDLEKGDSSDTHWHGGDELIWVASGKVHVNLPDSGAAIALDQGNFIHFDAEQRHVVEADRGEAAQIVVIRFDQLNGGIRRHAKGLLRELFGADGKVAATADQLKATLNDANFRFWYFSELEERQRRSVEIDSPNIPSFIANPVGFAQFLKSQGIGATQLRREVDWDQTAVQKLLNGVFCPDFPISELQKLNRLKQHFVEAMIYSYAFPRVPKVVRIGEKHWRNFPSDPKYGAYALPTRSLLGSNTSIAKITLAPGESSKENSHLGFEILIPISGECMIGLPDRNRESPILSPQTTPFAAFDSSHLHLIRNASKKAPAAMLVIRIFRTPQPEKPKGKVAPAGSAKSRFFSKGEAGARSSRLARKKGGSVAGRSPEKKTRLSSAGRRHRDRKHKARA